MYDNDDDEPTEPFDGRRRYGLPSRRTGPTMQVDRGGFLMFVSAMALGGAGGYVASEKDIVPHLSNRPATPVAAPIIAPEVHDAGVASTAAAAPVVVDAGPACDDTVGDVSSETCPPLGLPTVEGGCGSFATTRCNDFKQTMKPRVAKAAIACLNKLTGAERCDPKRVELCAHLALMGACEDPASNIKTSCDALTDACKSAPIAPSQNECRVAMSGLRETGREQMIDCAKKHCADKGVLGCEAAAPSK